MMKKLLITVAAAAAMSVPLAGAAWADQGDGNGNGGVPAEIGSFFDSVDANPNGTGNPLPPGSVYSKLAREQLLPPGSPSKTNVPQAVQIFVDNFYATYGGLDTDFGPTGPGLATKTFTPGCDHGHGGTDANGQVPGPICN